MKKKVMIIISLLIMIMLLVVGVIYGIPAYQEYQIQKAEEERRNAQAYYTEYHLTWWQFRAMISRFGVDVTPTVPLMHDPREEEWPDYSYYVMEPTEYTGKMVVVLSYNLFVDPQTKDDLEAAELAAEYGFSAENPITVEWVMEHPVEAVEIYKETRSLDYYATIGDEVEKKYNEIMGIEDTEETNATESGAE